MPLIASVSLSAGADNLKHSVLVGKGDRIAIHLLWSCKDASIECDASSVAVIEQPVEGVLFKVEENAVVEYQHGGTSLQPDYFSYLIRGEQSAEEFTVDVIIEVRNPNANVRILSPVQGATIQGRTVTIEYRVSGVGHNHVHVQLDGEGHLSVSPGSNSYTFTDVEPGLHQVTMSLANSKHKQLNGAGTLDSIEFYIE